MSPFEYVQHAIEQLDWKRQPQGLYAPIEYTLCAGGKRLRPALAVIASDLFDGDRKKVLPLALALEIFHNFTLLHDDLMDNAPIRRGRPTVHIQWNENTAVLSGDQMLIEAYRQLAQLDSELLHKILPLFNKMATEICEGQQYDVDFEQRNDVSTDDYLLMIRLKTSVLLATALQTGAIVAGATEQQQMHLYNYGINIGLAFQLQDDILDVYGNPLTFGKAIGGDILSAKKTYMLLTALSTADSATRQSLVSVLNNKTMSANEKISKVTDIYTTLGVRQICEDVMRNYTTAALAELTKINIPEEKKLILIKLADKLLARTE